MSYATHWTLMVPKAVESTPSRPEVNTNACKSTCINCSELEKKLELWMNHNKLLVTDLDTLKETNDILKANELEFETCRQALYIEVSDLQVNVRNHLYTIDSYANALEKEKKKVFEKEAEITSLKYKLSTFSNSSIMQNRILSSHRSDSNSKAGFGYETNPPPKDYTPVPVVDLESTFVPTSSMTAEPKTPEEKVSNAERSVKKNESDSNLKCAVNCKD